MPAFDPKTQELLVGMLMMAGLMVLAAIGIQVITIYRRRAKSSVEDTEADLAQTFEDAYEAGEIDTDEYRKIKDTMARGPVLSPVPKPSPTPASPSPPDAEANADAIQANADAIEEDDPGNPPTGPGA